MYTAFAISRAVHFASALLLFGAVAYRGVLPAAPNLPSVDRVLRIFMATTMTLAFVSGGVWLLFVAADMSGDAAAMHDPAMLRLVMLQTDFGTLWLWRLALGVGLVAVALIETMERRPFTVALAACFLASLAFTGHAAAGTGWSGFAHQLADATHLLCAGIWLGGLFLLVFISRDATPDGALTLLSRFSAIAIPAVILVILTGAANAFFIVPDWNAFADSRYGILLIVKTALVVIMLMLALLNRIILVPRLTAGNSAAMRHLLSSAMGEIVLGGAVLLVVGFLGISPPA